VDSLNDNPTFIELQPRERIFDSSAQSGGSGAANGQVRAMESEAAKQGSAWDDWHNCCSRDALYRPKAVVDRASA
jgi:hypothetical protein